MYKITSGIFSRILGVIAYALAIALFIVLIPVMLVAWILDGEKGFNSVITPCLILWVMAEFLVKD